MWVAFLLWISLWFFIRCLYQVGKALIIMLEQKYETKLQQGLTDIYLFIPIRQVVLTWLVFHGLVIAFVSYQGVSWLFIVSILPFSFVLPLYIYKRVRGTRQQLCMEQLPEACVLLANSLRTGGSMVSSIRFVGQYAPAPISQEFALVSRRLRIGMQLDVAFYKMKERMEHADFNRVIQAILIGQETGGQQAALLEKIADTLRAKLQLARRIKSLSAQGNIQGKVMSLLPFFMGFVLWVIEKDAMNQALSSQIGWVFGGVMLTLIGIGNFWIKKTIQIEVPL